MVFVVSIPERGWAFHVGSFSGGVVEWSDRARAPGEIQRSASTAAFDVGDGAVERIEFDERAGRLARPGGEVPVQRVSPSEHFDRPSSIAEAAGGGEHSVATGP